MMVVDSSFFQHHIQALLLAAASSTDNFLVGLSVGLSGKPLPWHVLWGISLCNAAGCWIATMAGGEGGGWVLGIAILGNEANEESNGELNWNYSHGSSSSSTTSNALQYLLAAASFGFLAYQEYQEQQEHQQQQQKTKKKSREGDESDADKPCSVNGGVPSKPASLQLALPMTLNNMAGGVTGGVMGLSPSLNALHALMISVVFMWLGQMLGAITKSHHPQQRHHHGGQRPPNDNKNQPAKTMTTTMHSSYNVTTISIALYLILCFQSFYEAIVVLRTDQATS